MAENKTGVLTVLGERGMLNTFTTNKEEIKGYVFYQSLKESDRPQTAQFGRAVEQALSYYVSVNQLIQSQNTHNIQTINRLKRMIAQESAKEKDFLKFTFGSGVNEDLKTLMNSLGGDPGKALSVFFNQKLQLEEDLLRLKTMLVQGKENNAISPNIGRFYGPYLSGILKDVIEDYVEKAILNKIDINSANFQQDLITEVFKSQKEIQQTAIEKMLSSKTPGIEEDKNAQTYLHILKELEKQGSIQNSAIFEYVMKNYSFQQKKEDIKNLIKKITETVGITKDKAGNITGAKFRHKGGKINGKSYSFKQLWKVYPNKGGEITERIHQIAINEVLQKLDNTQMKKVVIHTGPHQKKSDHDIVLYEGEVDEIAVEQLINKMYSKGTNRVENQKVIAELDSLLNNLKGMKQGYHIYMSDKDYLLRSIQIKNYEGISTGSPLIQFKKIANPDDYFLTALMNVIPGALGEDYIEELSSHLATFIAYYCFDNMEVFDQGVPSSQVKSIHLFYVSGFYLPLSSLLTILLQAFESASATEYQKYVKVELITPDSIQYPLSIVGKESDYTAEMWKNQAITALKQIKIKSWFMKNLREYIEELMHI